MTQGGPSPFSREGSRPEDALGAEPQVLDNPPATPPPAQSAPAYVDPVPQQPYAAYAPDPAYPPMQPFPAYPAMAAYGYPHAPAWPVARRSSPYATASLISGLVSLLVWITGPVAIGLGIAALVQVRREPDTYEGSGLAVGGLITGAFGSFILLMVVLALATTG
ncbi:DUF4190 domain-containing protein [Mariniluteicoccus flavus]